MTMMQLYLWTGWRALEIRRRVVDWGFKARIICWRLTRYNLEQWQVGKVDVDRRKDPYPLDRKQSLI